MQNSFGVPGFKSALVLAIVLSGCQSSNDFLDVGSTASTTATANLSTSEAQFQSPEIQPGNRPLVAGLDQGNSSVSAPASGQAFASVDPQLDTNNGVADPFAVSQPEAIEPPKPRTRKTYLLNGLVSAVPFIGFGLTNLQKKLPDSKLYSYLSPIEGSAAIAPKVTRDIIAAHAKDPDVEINLIGISYGANLITQIASKLHKRGIKVHYLGIIEGTSLNRIQSNVVTADNFTCTYLDCTRAKARLSGSNGQTQLASFKFNTSHIPMGNNKKMHDRIIRQINN